MDNLTPHTSNQGPDPLEKTCTGPCGRTLPATAEHFHHAKTCKDGFRGKCKNCNNARKREYHTRPDVKDRHKEYCKEYHSRPDIKKQQKEYYSREDVRERQKEYMKEYQRDYGKEYRSIPENKQRMQKYRKEYNARHDIKARYREYEKEYRTRSDAKDMHRIREHNRRASKRSVGGTYTLEQITDQLKRQHHKCYYCRKRLKKLKGKHLYHIEHTFPISRVAGTNIPANSISYLVLACPTCNLSKGDKFPWEWSYGNRLI
jgi:hypothetical protein